LIGDNKDDVKYLNYLFMLTCCFFANQSASPLKESLAYSLMSLYFSLRWVSLADYFLVLRALFSLLQMVRCTMVITSTACTLRWATTRTKGMVAPYILPDAFVGRDYLLALYLN
jgi:hypothetical protein